MYRSQRRYARAGARSAAGHAGHRTIGERPGEGRKSECAPRRNSATLPTTKYTSSGYRAPAEGAVRNPSGCVLPCAAQRSCETSASVKGLPPYSRTDLLWSSALSTTSSPSSLGRGNSTGTTNLEVAEASCLMIRLKPSRRRSSRRLRRNEPSTVMSGRLRTEHSAAQTSHPFKPTERGHIRPRQSCEIGITRLRSTRSGAGSTTIR
jgi:hypothetical protein